MTNPYRSPESNLEIAAEAIDYSDLPALVRVFARLFGTRLPWSRRVARGIEVIVLAALAAWVTGIAFSALLSRLLLASPDPEREALVVQVFLYSVPLHLAWRLLTLAGVWAVTSRPEVALGSGAGALSFAVRALAISAVVTWLAYTAIRTSIGLEWAAGEDPEFALRWMRSLPLLVNLAGSGGLAIAGFAHLGSLARRLDRQGLFLLGLMASGGYLVQWLLALAWAIVDPMDAMVGPMGWSWSALNGALAAVVSLFALGVLSIAYRFFNRLRRVEPADVTAA